jgi:hypothetical protein
MMIIYGNAASPVKAVVIKVIVCHVAGIVYSEIHQHNAKKDAYMLYFDFFLNCYIAVFGLDDFP